MLDNDYQKLKRWSENGCRTVWIYRTSNLPPVALPGHDLEINRIEQLNEVRDLDQSPTIAQCFDWLEEWDLPENIRRHITTVAWSAYTLACLLANKGEKVNPILTHRGGLLHDLDKIQTLREVNRHGKMGAEFLESQGYPAIAEIVRGHILHTILDPHSDDRSWEIKVVYFCDKLTEGNTIVTLDKRFAALGKRYPVYMEKMGRAKTHVYSLNDQICSILSIPDNEHLVSFLNGTKSDVQKELP